MSTEATQSMAKKIHANAWIECSAKTGENIEELFKMAAKMAAKNRSKKNKGGCCVLL